MFRLATFIHLFIDFTTIIEQPSLPLLTFKYEWANGFQFQFISSLPDGFIFKLILKYKPTTNSTQQLRKFETDFENCSRIIGLTWHKIYFKIFLFI